VTTPIFTRVGKQVLAHGYHYADGADELAAQTIVDALNARPVVTEIEDPRP